MPTSCCEKWMRGWNFGSLTGMIYRQEKEHIQAPHTANYGTLQQVSPYPDTNNTHTHTENESPPSPPQKNPKKQFHKLTIVKTEFPRDQGSEDSGLPLSDRSCATHLCLMTSLLRHFWTESAVVLSSSFSSSVFLSLRCEKPPPLSWTAVSEKTEVTSTHNPILTVSHRQEVLEGKNKVSVWVRGLIIGDRWNEYTRGHTRMQKYSPGASECICAQFCGIMCSTKYL